MTPVLLKYVSTLKKVPEMKAYLPQIAGINGSSCLKPRIMKGITFNELTLRDKANLVNELGCYLLSIESYNHLIHLYSLDTHLIEVYHLPGSRQIDAISLANFHDLDKYVACIAIANMGIVR